MGIRTELEIRERRVLRQDALALLLVEDKDGLFAAICTIASIGASHTAKAINNE